MTSLSKSILEKGQGLWKKGKNHAQSVKKKKWKKREKKEIAHVQNKEGNGERYDQAKRNSNKFDGNI
jgi:hypothetical protein